MIHDQLTEDAYSDENTILPRNSQLFLRLIEKQEKINKFPTSIKNDTNASQELIEIQKEMNKLLLDIKKTAEKEGRNQNRMLFSATFIGAGEIAGIFAAVSFLTWQSSGANYYLYLQLGLAVLFLMVGIVSLRTQDKNKYDV